MKPNASDVAIVLQDLLTECDRRITELKQDAARRTNHADAYEYVWAELLDMLHRLD